MNRVIRIVLVLCLAAAAAPSIAQDSIQAVEAKITEIGQMSSSAVPKWRWTLKDVPDAQAPSFDDSKWRLSEKNTFLWGKNEDKFAWLRTTITVPSDLAGVSLKGSRVTFTCGVDDKGILYVNGNLVQKFDWDKCSYVLAESVNPGDKFVIAIKAINTGYEGRLLRANIEYSAMDPVAEPVKALMQAWKDYHLMIQLASDSDKAKYLPPVARALDAVHIDDVAAGRTGQFRTAVQAVTAKLSDVSGLAKTFSLDLIGHAHIDMNWLWQWPETVEVCQRTFNSVARLAEDYPEMIYGQSQAAVYLAMQEQHPDVFAKIKALIKRGQWDPIASAWVEGDTNMSSGEAITRSILYGKRYMKQQFGTETDVGWLPDNFGHVWTLPQILAKSGIKYYYFMRCGIGKPLFWWEGPDGSRVLAFNWGGYNGDMGGDVASDVIGFGEKAGVRDMLRPIGVGDHGGGPTQAMLDRAREIKARPGYPQVKFTKVSDYFKRVLAQKQDFPVHKGELQFEFRGCWTTHADVKRWNRESENLLPAAETLSVLASSYGLPYPSKGFEHSWRNTAFNEFHDILCGSAIHPSYDYSRTLYEDATKQGRAALDASVKTLISKIPTKGPGIPVVVFNPLSWTRSDPVEVPSPFDGENTAVKVTDEHANTYAAQNIGDRLYFTARDVPALGYKVFWANRAAKPTSRPVTAQDTTIENQFFKVTVDKTKGVLTSVYDKINAKEVLLAGHSGSLLQVLMELPHGMTAWELGEIGSQTDLTDKSEVVLANNGPARATVTFDHSYNKSQFVQELTLYDAVPRIDIHLTADWKEYGAGGKSTPMLKVAFPTAVTNGKARFEIPFGSIERRANGEEFPAQKWIDLSSPDYGVSLLNNCKYGFDVNGGTMRMTLLRASHDPDPTPDQGISEVTYSLYPHKGDWRAASTVKRSYELNVPLIARVATSHSGSLPKSQSFVSVSESNIVVTALKKAEDGDGIILRFYETAGTPCDVTVTVNLPGVRVVETNLIEREPQFSGPAGVTIRDHKFTVHVGKYEIKTYKLMPYY